MKFDSINKIELEAVGKVIAAEAAPFIKELTDATAAGAEKILGRLNLLHDDKYGSQYALFENNKLVLKSPMENLSVWDVQEMSTNRPLELRRWLMFDKQAQGREFLHSIKYLNMWDDGAAGYSVPDILGTIAPQRAASDEFLSRAIPAGSIPIGHGASRVAFLTPDNDVALLGQRAFRLPAPDMLHPNSIATNGNLQVERLPRAEVDSVEWNDVTKLDVKLRETGFESIDWQLVNNGFHNGRLKVIDGNSIDRVSPYVIDRVTPAAVAIDRFNQAIARTSQELGVDSHPVAGFHSELGWHHTRIGNSQSAEEHLRTGLNQLESHGDWNMVAWTAQRLEQMYRDGNNFSMAKEFSTKLERAKALHEDWQWQNRWDWQREKTPRPGT